MIVRFIALSPAIAAVFLASACAISGAATPFGPAPATSAPSIAPSAAPPTRSPTVAPTPTSSRGGSLRIAQGSDPVSCDLHTAQASGYTSVHVCNPLVSQLVRVAANDHETIIPDLASSWSVLEESGRWKWTFEMRQAARWHDGVPVTAVDAKFSIDRIIAPPPGIIIGRAGAVSRYLNKPDDVSTEGDILVVRTDHEFAAFLPALSSVYMSIYPEHAVRALSPASMVNFLSVVGSGPFSASEATRGSTYILKRSDSYYEEGLPYLDEVRFLIMADPAVRLAGLKSKAVDAIAIVTEPEAVSLQAHAPSSGTGIRMFSSPSAGGSTVQMNLHRPPFDNATVRRAVNLAISRGDADLALGAGLVGAVMPPGGRWALSEDEIRRLPGYGDAGANREKARSLLRDAGLDGGFAVSALVRADPFSQTLGDFVAGQLAEVGITVQVKPVEPGAYQDTVLKRDFAMIVHSHSFVIDDPDFILFDNYSCAGLENYPGLCDPSIDNLLLQQSRAADPVERKGVVDSLQRAIWAADAKVWLQWTLRRSPAWSDVHGLEPGGPSFYQGRRLERVWLER